MSGFKLVEFEYNRHLTMMHDKSHFFGDIAVTYLLIPQTSYSCRLLVKLVVRYPRGAKGWLMRRVLPWGDLIMMRRQLLNFRKLSEDTHSFGSGNNIFFEIHKNNPREGPGNNDSTRIALSLLENLPENSNILDIGCGPGMQTIELAKNIEGNIIALDNHQPFLDELNIKSQKEGLNHKIKIVNGSMFNLKFDYEYFDLIWSEGGIYIIGFKRGLHEWKNYLKKGGYLGVSEISWLCDNIPKEPLEFWHKSYPEMNSVDNNLKIIKDSGYKITGHFTLPETAWWEGYYNHIEKNINILKKKYASDNDALKVIDEEEYEMELFRKYSEYYGYEFYIMKK